ncbi:MAG: hypothetical protein LBH12_06720 [Dysgonamonadaceae bacterium]|jgi:gas vesicle protein|nr:hypothetical protein [Dysgonamonadaceae bacterium]
MKSSSLFLGLGIGLLVGAAVTAYLITSDDDKQEFFNEIGSAIKKAKKSISQVVDDGLDELNKTADKVTKAAQDSISKIKKEQA